MASIIYDEQERLLLDKAAKIHYDKFRSAYDSSVAPEQLTEQELVGLCKIAIKVLDNIHQTFDDVINKMQKEQHEETGLMQ